jgi:hypothetical protein
MVWETGAGSVVFVAQPLANRVPAKVTPTAIHFHVEAFLVI